MRALTAGCVDPQGVGGPAKAAERADREEGLDLRDLHLIASVMYARPDTVQLYPL